MLIGLYNKSGLSEIKNDLAELLERNPDRNIVIGDWNARIGTLSDRCEAFSNTIQTLTVHLMRIFNQCINGEPILGAWRYTNSGRFTRKDQTTNLKTIEESPYQILYINYGLVFYAKDSLRKLKHGQAFENSVVQRIMYIP